MIRRSFRMGLTLGVLAGLVVALVKIVQNRPAPVPASPARPWTPLDDGPMAARTAAPSEPKPEPVVARVETIVEPLDAEAAEPVEPLADVPSTPPEPLADVPSTPPEPLAPVEKSVEPPKKAPPRKKAATKKAAAKKVTKRAAKAAAAPWVEATEGTCPSTHPVKAKLSSMIFHLPGMFAYDRTRPDRCYRDGVAAESDGFRPAKR